MTSRTVSSGATAAPRAGSRARVRPDDLRAPADALAVLETLRRDGLLEAVAMAAKELLRLSDLAVSLPKVAAEIGIATGVDRTHIFLVDSADGDGQILHRGGLRPLRGPQPNPTRAGRRPRRRGRHPRNSTPTIPPLGGLIFASRLRFPRVTTRKGAKP